MLLRLLAIRRLKLGSSLPLSTTLDAAIATLEALIGAIIAFLGIELRNYVLKLIT
jgi:hypothetical protein